MYSAWAVRQIAYIQEEMDFKSQLKANIPNQLVWWIRFSSSQCLPWPGFFCLRVNETGHMVSDQTIHLWNRAIHLVTQESRNMEHRQGRRYENGVLKLTEKSVLQEPVNPRSFYSTFSAYLFSSRRHQAALVLAGCLSGRPPSLAERPSFSAPKPAPEKLACADFAVIKSRQAGRPAQWQQEEPVCSQLLALTAGLLRGTGMSSQLCSVGRKRLISACLPFRDSTAQALFHLQMIKWSTGQLWTEGRSSRLSPGFLDQPDWISQRKAAVATAGSMTFPEKCSPV